MDTNMESKEKFLKIANILKDNLLARDEFINWYKGQIDLVPLNLLDKYDIFVTLGVFDKYLYVNNIIYLYNLEHILIRYRNCCEKDNTSFIQPHSIGLKILNDLDIPPDYYIFHMPILQEGDDIADYIDNKIRVVEYVFEHRNKILENG